MHYYDMSEEEEDLRAELACLQTSPVPKSKSVKNIEMKNAAAVTPNCCTAKAVCRKNGTKSLECF